jgi:ferredoxin-thioredoxin reductase catalytic subunit
VNDRDSKIVQRLGDYLCTCRSSHDRSDERTLILCGWTPLTAHLLVSEVTRCWLSSSTVDTFHLTRTIPRDIEKSQMRRQVNLDAGWRDGPRSSIRKSMP